MSVVGKSRRCTSKGGPAAFLLTTDHWQLTTASTAAVIRTLTPYPCSGIVVLTLSVSVLITVITCESLHTTYTLPVGDAADVAIYTGCPLIGIVAVTVFEVRFTTDTVQVVDTPATATPFAAHGRFACPALATYARV